MVKHGQTWSKNEDFDLAKFSWKMKTRLFEFLKFLKCFKSYKMNLFEDFIIIL
jgi:hypothetical protein